jgi:ubiquinone/menaquinone biosynthesis C-methylase UbiE
MNNRGTILEESYLSVREYAQFVNKYSFKYRKIAKAITKIIKQQNGIIIDIGTGVGSLAIELRKYISNTIKIIGQEIDSEMMEFIISNKIKRIYSLEFVLSSDDILPFKSNSVDVIISANSIHHWKKPVAMFNEIFRVLKVNELFSPAAFLFDLNRASLRARLFDIYLLSRMLFGESLTKGYHQSLKLSYTIPEIRNILSKTDIKKVEILPFGMEYVIKIFKSK